jgi:hypothetical protein
MCQARNAKHRKPRYRDVTADESNEENVLYGIAKPSSAPPASAPCAAARSDHLAAARPADCRAVRRRTDEARPPRQAATDRPVRGRSCVRGGARRPVGQLARQAGRAVRSHGRGARRRTNPTRAARTAHAARSPHGRGSEGITRSNRFELLHGRGVAGGRPNGCEQRATHLQSLAPPARITSPQHAPPTAAPCAAAPTRRGRLAKPRPASRLEAAPARGAGRGGQSASLRGKLGARCAVAACGVRRRRAVCGVRWRCAVAECGVRRAVCGGGGSVRRAVCGVRRSRRCRRPRALWTESGRARLGQ